jgi:general secretion pathway protein G
MRFTEAKFKKVGRVKLNRKMRRRRRQGFTLLELLLVMAILVILASLSTVAVLSMQSNAQNKAAFTQISTLKTQCINYKLSTLSFPKKLEDLVTLPAGMNQSSWGGPYLSEPTIPKDPWQNPYKYSAKDATDEVFISSAGKDGQHGTADDIPGKG